MILTRSFLLFKFLTTPYGILVQERSILFFLHQLARAHIVRLTLMGTKKKNLDGEIDYLHFK